MTRREDDIVDTIINCSTHDYVMFFTSKGKTYRIKAYEIAEGSRISKGMNIVNILPLESGEKITAVIRVPREHDESIKYLCMFTKKGIVKRSEISVYGNIRKSGVIAITLDDDDELIHVSATTGEDDIFLATKKGMCIRFNENDARVIGRTARGVRAITLKEGDEIAGADVIKENRYVLTVSETGYGRRSEITDYRVQNRGGLGLINYRTSEYGDVAAVRIVTGDEDIILISSDGIIIRIPSDSISVFSRPSKGVRVMKIEDDRRVVTMTCIERGENAENDEAESNDNETVLDGNESQN